MTMDEHKKFLADKLLSEEQPISYRLLSRALDVHVNTAKEMLYDFHKYQNGLQANSIHATYLISGTRSSNDSQDEDVEMTSSMPEQESEGIPTTVISLVREEDLKKTLADYQRVNSIHVYSLSPHPQKDLSLLSDVSTQLVEYKKKEDPAVLAKKYGIIANPQVRKRDRKGRAPVAAPAVAKPVVKQEAPKPTPATKTKQEPAAKPSPFAPKLKQEASDSSSKESTPVSSVPGPKKTAPPLKRGGSGSIMQSFAKAKPPKPKPAPKKEEDTTMALSDDGEADDDDDILGSKKPAVDAEEIRRIKKEREEALRKMMEEDDDEEDEPSEKEEEQADEEMEETPEPEPEPEPEAKAEEPAEMVSSTANGRRRGKRRVMKKKRILDDQGYMVTIQEPGWESFSEDEAPPPAKKPAPTPPAPSSAPKAKKPAGKGGQGNIMSFFSKM